jgi:hypothetical protein
MKDLVAWYKANPTKANYGSPAPGSLPHFFGVMIAKGSGVELVHVPYNGGGPMMNALMGDQLTAAIDTTVEQVELHRTGRARILATSGATRSTLLPDVPTFTEQGLSGVEGTAWFAVYAPAKTPEATVRQLNAAINKAIANPELRERFLKLGLEPAGGTARGSRRPNGAGFSALGADRQGVGFSAPIDDAARRRGSRRGPCPMSRATPTRRPSPTAIAAAALVAGAATVHAQSIEPRSYSNAPVGLNFLIGGAAYTRGGIAFDSSLPLTEPNLTTTSAVLGYARVLDLWGRSGKFDVVIPYTRLSGSALYLGDSIERNVTGLADPAFRLSMNFYGAPALSLSEFKSYEQDLIVGASLQVLVPVGQYDPTRLVNIGTNRWYFKPEIGVSKAVGPWTLEGMAAVTLFTTNGEFFNGNRRSQDPLYSIRTHLIYNFPRGIWGSADATYFAGGRTTLNGTLNDDLQQNWRLGATLAFPVDARHSARLYASRGVSARTGNSFDLIGAAWQYRWGAGL